VDITDFLTWAWARHHNILSWYIRPLFLIPFCYFAYKRSWVGILGTLIALATSMFWFPAPQTPDPRVEEFLAMEVEWIAGRWTLWKALLTLLVPASLALLAFAFWKRSAWYGVGVLTFIALSKILWSIAFGGESASALLPPAIIGLAVCNLAVYFGVKWIEKRQHREIAGHQQP
jgi:hypothetical protein